MRDDGWILERSPDERSDIRGPKPDADARSAINVLPAIRYGYSKL
jgi:hypothetical protein